MGGYLMKVNVEYDEYNTKMVKAEIPVSEYSLFSIEVVKETVDSEKMGDEENEQEPVEVEKLVITCIDETNSNQVKLSMTKSDVREFVTLLNNFRNSMK